MRHLQCTSLSVLTTGAAVLSITRPCSPAVILSFLVAGFSALLSALCYSEFAAEVRPDLSAMYYT